ncbi:hypothetical protein D3C81_1637600 [compost metagenome]
MIAHRIQYALIGRTLFFDIRRGLTIDEQKLSAQQTNAISAVGEGICRFTAGGNVGDDFDGHAVAGFCRQVSLGLLCVAALLTVELRLLNFSQAFGIWRQFEASTVGIEHHRLALSLIKQGRTQRHHARQTFAASENCHMRRRATLGHA